MCCFFECLYLILFPPPLSLYVSMYLCIYVSMYLCIYLSMYVCMYLCMYIYIYVFTLIWIFVLLTVSILSFTCPTMQLVPGMADYVAGTRPLSPWRCVDGWHLGTVFHDPMHFLYLGTLRDLYASALGYWLRNGYYGDGTMPQKLRAFSKDLKDQSRRERSFGKV